MHTSRYCLVGIALAAISTLSTAQTQHPLTQQLQNNPLAPVQSRSYQLSPANTAATQAVTSSAVPATSTPNNVPAAPARVTPTAAPVVQTVSTPAAAQPQASAAPAQTASNSTVVRNANTSAPAAATPSRTYAPRAPMGDVTRTLLAIQASPNRSGTPHTVLGETATRSWDRYLRSFESDIPERFQQLEAQRSSR